MRDSNSHKTINEDCSVQSLCIILSLNGVRASPERLRHDYANAEGLMDKLSLVRAAQKSGLQAKSVKVKAKKLHKMPLPALAELRDGRFILLAKHADGQLLLQIPGQEPKEVSIENFSQEWSGHLILMTARSSSMTGDIEFGLRWFLPVMVKYKKLFSEVLVASFFLQTFGLITPLFFQVIIDKVLVHKGLTTLDVLIIGLLGLTVFEALLGFLRTYIFSHTTSRVDAQLGGQLFDHLLSLPIAYFENRATGQTVARVRELDSVREFLTSSALTVVIDLLFTGVFFAVMWLFSPTLTLIVLASIPCYLIVSIAITPSLRRRVEERFYRGATNQSFLVESISGVETLKAMAVEPQMRNQWEKHLAAYVGASFRAIILGTAGSQAVMLINKITTAVILWYGASLVMANELTVGQLVAFNMLAGQVSQPVIRLAQLWQDFQQFRIYIQRLGDILNTKTELPNQATATELPPIVGDIHFQNVTFRYRTAEPEILRDLSLKIPAGQTVGIVGASGSGKSTITKLIQRMYVPQQGRLLIDDIDVSLLDPAWLRRQIGVVLQDNILFNRTVAENIAFSDPATSMPRIIRAAELAGAHDFIMQLPMGYDTVLEERGSNLSGGQRQRVAIARALVMTPRILILDEATAALDYESERVFQDNLKLVAKGRTVIIVAHRLSTVKNADQIFVMDKGQVAEVGTHDFLIAQGGIYSRLAAQS